MGWSFSPRFSQRNDKKDFIEDILQTQENDNVRHECIAHCCRGNNLWAVWQVTRKKDNKEVSSFRYICCHLLSYAGRGDACWGVKDVDESMGPISDSCPEKYFKMVSECFISESEFALEWRNSIKEKNQKKKNFRKKLKENFHKAQENGDRCILKLVGATIDEVEIISLKPLRSQYYRIPRKMIGDSYIQKRKIIGTNNPNLIGSMNNG